MCFPSNDRGKGTAVCTGSVRLARRLVPDSSAPVVLPQAGVRATALQCVGKDMQNRKHTTFQTHYACGGRSPWLRIPALIRPALWARWRKRVAQARFAALVKLPRHQDARWRDKLPGIPGSARFVTRATWTSMLNGTGLKTRARGQSV